MKILILDDQSETAEMLGEYIKTYIPEAKYDIANNYYTALKYSDDYKYDVLVADIFLDNNNGKTGLDFAKKIKKKQEWIKTIIYTGHIIEYEMQEIFNEISPDSFLRKPLDMNVLVKRIKDETNYKTYTDRQKMEIEKMKMQAVRHESEIGSLKNDVMEIKDLINKHVIPRIDNQFTKIVTAITAILTLFTIVNYIIKL